MEHAPESSPITRRGGDLSAAVEALDDLLRRATRCLAQQVTDGDALCAKKLEQHQLGAHALAFLATEYQAASQLVSWATRAGGEGTFEHRIAGAYVGELCRQLAGGVEIGPCESIGPEELGLQQEDIQQTIGQAVVSQVVRTYASGDAVCGLAREAQETSSYGDWRLEDDTLDAIRTEFRKFTEREVCPIAQDVHRNDVLIPMDLIEKMAEMGVFGLTIPEEYDGQGLSKVAMCVVTEELSRGYIGAGSLGTRSEIAAELIMGGGTEEQKQEWLPKLSTGEVLPTAVFTEPNFGSDLAHIKTRGEKQPDGSWKIYGAKTWITHATRADLMTLLVRTNPDDAGYAGNSMLLASKSRGSETAPETQGFPDEGITGTEIKVLGYRGMKEFEIGFDGFHVSEDALLGGEEGRGFKQLMVTFESARIQTAARGVGMAQAALEESMRYANDRVQFGGPLFQFPRVQRKIGRMIARTMATRQLAFHAARAKDAGRRCDLEAGMAKLLGTRAAWEAADACVQIHGGNGYAEEYTASRLLADSRVLSIFEGANEIQANVIARRLLEQQLKRKA